MILLAFGLYCTPFLVLMKYKFLLRKKKGGWGEEMSEPCGSIKERRLFRSGSQRCGKMLVHDPAQPTEQH